MTLRDRSIPIASLLGFLTSYPTPVLLRNADFVANLARGGDVDLLTEDVEDAKRRLVERVGEPLFAMRRPYVTQVFYPWGHIDLAPGIQWKGCVYLDSSDVRRMAVDGTNGTRSVHPAHEAVICWFASLAWGGFFKERYREQIVSAALDFREKFYLSLGYAVGPKLAQTLVSMAAEGHPGDSRRLVRRIRRALFLQSFRRNPCTTVRGYFGHWVSEIRHRGQPAAPFVVFLGPDGAGKSTIIANVTKRLTALGLKSRTFHWRPMMIRGNRSGMNVVNDPHGRPPRGFLTSTVKLALYTADWLLGYWFRIVHLRAKGVVVIFDRHFVDALVDPARYRLAVPGWAIWLCSWLLPRPDSFFILTSSPDVLLARKQEVARSALIEQLKRYNALAASDSGVQLDAAQTPEALTDQVVRAIINRFKIRELD